MREHAGNVDIVVTHWPPTLDALDPIFTLKKRDRALNPYFVNDAEDLVHEMEAKLWVSGHVHRPHEAQVGETLSVGNPAGYRKELRRKGVPPRSGGHAVERRSSAGGAGKAEPAHRQRA